MIGSKKKHIDPINLLIVVGIPILKTSFILFLLGLKSFFVSLKFFGRKKNSTNIEVSSLMTFVKTTKATAYSKPNFKNIGIPIIKLINLITSSVMFEITCGIMFCLPKKYPLKMLEMLIKGKTNPIQTRA